MAVTAAIAERAPRAGGRALPLALLALLLAACGPEVEPGEAHTYRTRGLVRRIEAPQGGGTELWLHHEAIPEFVDIEGRVVGMEAMTMPFPVGDDVDLAGLEPGDRVALEFTVDWRGERPLRVTAVDELPADTRLDFEPPPPADAAAAPSG